MRIYSVKAEDPRGPFRVPEGASGGSACISAMLVVMAESIEECKSRMAVD